MPRPRKHRCCRRYAADRVYKPQGLPLGQVDASVLSIDQFEALRLCDVEQLDQEAAGERMGVSRGTIQRLLYGARKQIVEAILHNHTIVINLKKSEATNAGLHSHQRKRRARRHGV